MEFILSTIVLFLSLSLSVFGQSPNETCKFKFKAHDFSNAKAYCLVAAQDGDIMSQTYLGIIYLSESNTDSARVWFEKSANQGEPSGQNGLGYLYQHGSGGLPRDIEKANEWFLKSAKQGNSDSQFWLGENLFLGGNKKEGYEWTLKASLGGSANAQFNLASMLHNGDGTTKDEAAAIMWFIISATNENDQAKEFVDGLKAKLSPSAFQDYIKKTEDFVKQNPGVVK